MKCQDHNSAVGIIELEKEAKLQGLDKEHGKKMFYRSVSGMSPRATRLTVIRFRVFYMACAELFGLNGGDE